MALDEYIFGKIANYLKLRKIALNDSVHTVNLSDIQIRLTFLARALTGRAIEIFPAEREGGFKGNNFFLPSSMSLFNNKEKNLSFYFYRILYLTTQKELQLNWYAKSELNNDTAQHKALETSNIVLKKLFYNYTIADDLYHQLKQIIEQNTSKKEAPDYTWLYGKWMADTKDDASTNNLLNEFSDTIKKSGEDQIKTVLSAKAVEEVITVEIDKKQQEDYVLTHNFEKVETAEEHSGIWRDFDGDDELKSHQHALDELNLKYTVRVDDTAHSIYHAEFIENTTISESALLETTNFHYTYDEWNYSKKTYIKNYCNVYPYTQQDTDSKYYQNTIKDYASVLLGLRKMLTSINNKQHQVNRQSEGEEFELDALNDMFVDIKSRQTPDEKIYLSKRKKEKDISILLLIDISLSSDGYADGRRVIDVEKQVSILFGEILNEYNIDFSIYGFFSKTRNFTTYISLKEFDEKWNIAKNKIGAVQPSGYTRIGAAIRHSAFLLAKRSAKRKWLILLSDGKPNDYDKYEGKYGIHDVKQALQELNKHNINSFALAIEAQSKYYLPQMFGQNHYQIITTPLDLLKSLVKLYEKIKY